MNTVNNPNAVVQFNWYGDPVVYTDAAVRGSAIVIGMAFLHGVASPVERNSIVGNAIVDHFEARHPLSWLDDRSRESVLRVLRRVEHQNFVDSDYPNTAGRVALWNSVRSAFGLPRLTQSDLPSWDNKLQKRVVPAGSQLLSTTPKS